MDCDWIPGSYYMMNSRFTEDIEPVQILSDKWQELTPTFLSEEVMDAWVKLEAKLGSRLDVYDHKAFRLLPHGAP